MNALLLTLTLLPTADPDMRAIIEEERMKLLIAQTRKEMSEANVSTPTYVPEPVKPVVTFDPPEQYAKLKEQAERENRPLIVLVNTDGSRNSNYLYYKTTKFETYSQPTTVISLPNGQGTLFWMRTLNQYNQSEVDEFVKGYWNPSMIKTTKVTGYNTPVNPPQTFFPGNYQPSPYRLDNLIRGMDCSSGVCRPIQ